jgi:L-arabinose 1- dehydrogenase
MEDSHIKVGVIGLGHISQYYIAAIKKNVRYQLVAVCDLKETTTELYSREGIAIYSDYGQLLLNDDVHAVIICLPNSLHYKVCRDALLTNKHVCCEKPLTVTLAEAQELSKLSLAQKVVLFGAFHRRYNKNLIKVIDKLKSMPIAHVEGNYLEKIEEHSIGTCDNWYLDIKSAGGGCIMDNGPNVYDTLVQFMEHLEVTSVDIKRAPNNGIDMAATVVLISNQGVQAIVHLDWAYEGERKDIIVEFQDGTECVVDMLADSNGFKSSLWHEYEGIIDDFYSRIELCKIHYDEKAPLRNTPTSNTTNLALHGKEAVEIVRLVCNTYAKENEQEVEHLKVA